MALLNQYRKLTNCYFLMILVLSFIPAITPYSPLLQLLAVRAQPSLRLGVESVEIGEFSPASRRHCSRCERAIWFGGSS